MEQKIICPKCGDELRIEDSTYSKIVLQVRDSEFKKEISAWRNKQEWMYRQENEKREERYAEELKRAETMAELRSAERLQKKFPIKIWRFKNLRMS